MSGGLDSSVKFGSADATWMFCASATLCQARSPEGVGTVDVTVRTPGGTSSIAPASKFSYHPTVVGLDPSSAPGGAPVSIIGAGFTPDLKVMFGSELATEVTYLSPNSCTATSPQGAGQVPVTVQTSGGKSATSEATQFSYQPTVARLEPSSGRTEGGTTVAITGTGFTPDSIVMFGSTSATEVSWSSTAVLTATSPKGEGTAHVTVRTPAGTSAVSQEAQFSWRDGP
jgi:hypothetical protein